METTLQRTNTVKRIKKQPAISNERLLAEAEALLTNGDRMMTEEAVDIRQRLGDIPQVLNLSYVASRHFGRSRAWLYQRINGNRVNGKSAYFTRAERRALQDALHDIGRQLLDIKLV